ncbi:MAG: hypothetical protein ACI8WT_004259 [Clostridium sp.]|jgi:hypothetical protein
MKKKIVISVLAVLMIVATTYFSAFATMPNGTVVIGTKSYDLAYANDIANLTEVTNSIIQGGAVYVKDFSANWIDNITGLKVNASLIPGEDGDQVATVEVVSASAINATKNIGDAYAFPTTVTVILADKSTKDLDVTWDNVASTKVAGAFTFTGRLAMVDGVVNTSNVTVSATLTIERAISDNTDITSKFTDERFRDAVYTLIGKTSPEPILYSDVKNLKELNVDSYRISSLSGIEYFTKLSYLDCQCNELINLDVSKNINLITLDCRSNQLKTLDLGKNTVLDELYCFYNNLTTLDVSKNTSLTDLECYRNQLTTLDVSKNIGLITLWCYSNQLTTLDVSKNTVLDDLTCNSNQLTTLDVSKNTALTELWCDGNQLTTLDVSKNINLTTLECNSNQLTTLDVSKNTALDYFHCRDNQLTTLYSTKDTWQFTNYHPQYTDSSQTTTYNLVITIKN